MDRDYIQQTLNNTTDSADERALQARNKPVIDADSLVRRIEEAPSLPAKAEALWSLPALERHAALGILSAETIAAMIDSNPEENTALLGNLPAQKFNQIINLGPPEHGRRWLERAVSSKMLAGLILPALVPPRDLMMMLMTSSEFRASLSGLLNFRRAEEMRTILHPMEWKKNLNDLLLADAEELLHKAPIKDRNIRAVMQTLIDLYPELYLDVIRKALEQAKYREDHGEELADLTEMPLSMPEFLSEDPSVQVPAAAERAHDAPRGGTAAGDLIPTNGDPFLKLATSALPVDRRDQLEAELKDLLRREILATGSFTQADLLRAAGRLLFQIRAGLIQTGAQTPESATQVLIGRSFGDVVLAGARVAERYRQRTLQLSGIKEWLDRTQRQFMAAMNTLEPGMDPVTGEPVLYLASRTAQPREDWKPMPLAQVDKTLDEIAAWASLARAAFGSPARVQSIFATLKTKSAMEAVRRTVIALCLYRRWEPELANPGEDFKTFRAEFADELGRYNAARQVVLEALDATPADVWRPADGKSRARTLLLDAIDQMERQPKPRRAEAQPEEEEEDVE